MDGYAVKTIGEWELEVLGVPFGGPHGGRDLHGEFFDAQTNVYADIYQTIPALKYHGGFDRKPVVVGTATHLRQDERGHWYTVKLDKSKPEAAQMMQAAKEQQLFGSTGSVMHLVRKVLGNQIVDQLGRVISRMVGALKEGYIMDWPAAELSLLDLRKGEEPANLYAVALPALKAAYKQAGLSLPENLEPDAEAAEAARQAQRSADGERQPKPKGARKMADIELTKDQLERQLADARREGREALQKDFDANAKHEQEKQETADAAVKAARLKWEEEHADALAAEKKKTEDAQAEAEKAAAKSRRLQDNPDEIPDLQHYAETAKFDHLDVGAHALMVGILDAAKQSGRSKKGPSENAIKALAIKIVDEASRDKERRYVRPLQAMKMANMPLKANELNQSTLANYGDEWVSVAYSSELWERIATGSEIVKNIPTIVVPQGSESIVIPLQSTPPTFYKVAQASALDGGSALGHVTPTVPASKMGTANQTLSVAKMGARTIYTGELEEDSMVPWAEELRASLVQEGQEVLEHVAIDGDTEAGATANINDIAGTPAGTEAFMLFNGFRKLALVTNTANSRDAGTLTVQDFLETVKLLGLGGRNALQKDKVALITDVWTAWAALGLSEVLTRDVFSAPTLEYGSLTGLWGYKLFASGNMHRANQDATYGLKANAAGKIDLDVASNNTKGAILAVRWDQWRMGIKRRMTIETTRIPNADATEIVALMRVGMVYRDPDAAAISYNVSI